MIGTIGLDLPQAYTAADCTRYGPTLIALNCGDPAQPRATADVADDTSWMDAVAARIAELLATDPGLPAASGDEDPKTSAQRSPDAPTPPTPTSGGLLELISGLGATLGGRGR